MTSAHDQPRWKHQPLPQAQAAESANHGGASNISNSGGGGGSGRDKKDHGARNGNAGAGGVGGRGSSRHNRPRRRQWTNVIRNALGAALLFHASFVILVLPYWAESSATSFPSSGAWSEIMENQRPLLQTRERQKDVLSKAETQVIMSAETLSAVADAKEEALAAVAEAKREALAAVDRAKAESTGEPATSTSSANGLRATTDTSTGTATDDAKKQVVEEAPQPTKTADSAAPPTFTTEAAAIPADYEPYAIIHVGPHKTGTTTMQRVLSLRATQTYLDRDGIRVPNMTDLPGSYTENAPMNFAHCCIAAWKKDGGEMNWGQCFKVWTAFKPFVNEAYEKRNSIIVVGEDMDRRNIDIERMKWQLQPYKKIQVVVLYRRLHDWLPSWYNQIMSMYLPNYANMDERMPSYVEWIQKNYKTFLSRHSSEVAKRYRTSFRKDNSDPTKNVTYTVKFMNFHDGKMLENFFCNVVPGRGANETCTAVKEDRLEMSVANRGVNLEFDRLVIAAKNRSLIDQTITQLVMLKRVVVVVQGMLREVDLLPAAAGSKTHDVNTTYSLFGELPCLFPPNDFLDKMYETTIQHEVHDAVGYFKKQGGKEGLRVKFDKAVRTKMASLDIEKILDDHVLDKVWEKLNKCKFRGKNEKANCFEKYRTDPSDEED